MLHISQKHKVILLASFALFLAVVFVGAYSGLIPTEIRAIPYYDSIGHFVLYGLLAYLAVTAYQRSLNVGGTRVPIAIIAVALTVGLWFFPDSTRSIVGFAATNAKPAANFAWKLIKFVFNLIPSG